ncbi:deoxyribonuclease V [Stenotrophomonas sp. ATCM1_4]|uniref:deoxyribonuclease V n=1 Tax=Stenotrophomonas sp. ATCM1_4 TaxID=2259330 RepID=UPI00104506DB|nr:deoxyribonuclease V [Stenotrophomonas sp. ATCM1_4]TDB28218.1 deoxyribonuclease V [Stenotrophomonas sp. ATCM1_4]
MDTSTPAPDYARLRQQQRDLAAQVELVDAVQGLPGRIAGVDTGFEEGGSITRSAAVLLDGQSLQPLHSALARRPTALPYIPGLLSFRELPAALEALAQLPAPPALVMVDGHGIAHPRGLGIAAHLGVLTGLPSIGIGKSRLVGDYEEPGPQRGDHSPLLFKGRQVGWVLRSKPRCKPLFVSPGHRVSVAQCLPLVVACLAGYRLPEPTRLADRLASRR